MNDETKKTEAGGDAFDRELRALLRRTHDTPTFDERATLARIEASVADAGDAAADAVAAETLLSRSEPTPGSAQGAGSSENGRAAAIARAIWGGRLARPVLAAAASLALFIGGAEYGRRTTLQIAAPAEAPPAPALIADAHSLPLRIQSAGSQYIASLARLGDAADRLTPEQRRTAREVALAALLGAALELLDDDTDDSALRSAADLIADVKAGLATEPGISGTQF